MPLLSNYASLKSKLSCRRGLSFLADRAKKVGVRAAKNIYKKNATKQEAASHLRWSNLHVNSNSAQNKAHPRTDSNRCRLNEVQESQPLDEGDSSEIKPALSAYEGGNVKCFVPNVSDFRAECIFIGLHCEHLRF